MHLTFDEPGNGPGGSVYWSDQTPLKIIGGAGHEDVYPVAQMDVDAQGRLVVAVAYPLGTPAGPAEGVFYSIAGGLRQWQSDIAPFTADPAACVDVDLPVHFVDLAAPDAGPDAAP